MESPPERWIEIRTQAGDLVTVIEIASPSNKRPSGRVQFEAKIQSLLRAGVNVLEIDLLRGGTSAGPVRDESWPESPYQVVVNRAASPSRTEVYPCPLDAALPVVGVPLRAGEGRIHESLLGTLFGVCGGVTSLKGSHSVAMGNAHRPPRPDPRA